MKRIVLGGAAVAALLGLAMLLSQQAGSATTYTNKAIDMGAVNEDVAGCPAEAGYSRLVCLATAFKAKVSPELLARLQLPYTTADARQWSNFPPMGFKNRIGPTLGEMTPEQLAVAKAVLKEAAGIAANEGYDEMEQILNADDYLFANTKETGFAAGNYHLAFLGEPAAAGTWQLYFGGHHLAFANTYADGKLTGATPSFRGVEPFTTFELYGRQNAPLAQEKAAFAAMLTALSPEELGKAKLAQTYTNIVAGPQQDDAFPSAREGIKASELSPDKQALVIAAIETYVRDIAAADADVLMAKYNAELAETFVAFSGTPQMNTENDYVRIDGPSLWIESSMQPGRSIPGMHPHSVWRDRTQDYGGNK